MDVIAVGNSGPQDGVSEVQHRIEDGMRHGTAAAYVRPVEGNSSLELSTGASVPILEA